jgi:hypothetical protein
LQLRSPGLFLDIVQPDFRGGQIQFELLLGRERLRSIGQGREGSQQEWSCTHESRLSGGRTFSGGRQGGRTGTSSVAVAVVAVASHQKGDLTGGRRERL